MGGNHRFLLSQKHLNPLVYFLSLALLSLSAFAFHFSLVSSSLALASICDFVIGFPSIPAVLCEFLCPSLTLLEVLPCWNEPCSYYLTASSWLQSMLPRFVLCFPDLPRRRSVPRQSCSTSNTGLYKLLHIFGHYSIFLNCCNNDCFAGCPSRASS